MLTLLIAHPVTMNTKESRPSRLLRISSIRRGMTMSTGDIKIPISTDAVFSLQRHRKVVLVVDLVESVSLMQADELGVITRWQAFLAHVNQVVLPNYKGRLVKSLGDGLIVEFDHAAQGIAAVMSMHAWMEVQNSMDSMRLRSGLHVANIYSDKHDIYGTGVNLASRLATLAGPGETVVSEAIYDETADGLDCVFEDMGERFLKHLPAPERVWRAIALAPGIERAKAAPSKNMASLMPVIAILPFSSRSNHAADFAIGDLIADGLIDRMSRTPEFRIISRLSTKWFRDRSDSVRELQSHVAADYVIDGSYTQHTAKILVTVELVEAKSQAVIWTMRRDIELEDLFQNDSELCNEIAHGCHHALLDSNAKAASTQPLPTLQSYSLLLGGIGLMHRSGAKEFMRTREVFDVLIERHSRAASPRVWLAKWHVLCSTRGLVVNTTSESALALDHTKRALDMEPASSIAMAMQGFVYCHLLKDMDRALASCNDALDQNTNESLAWLFKAMVHAFDGNGSEAWPAGEKALMLSPVDPLRYYYDSLMASIAISAGRYSDAIVFAKRSLRVNSVHLSTYRALMLAQALSGDLQSAGNTLKLTMQRDPNFSISRFARNYPSRDRVPNYLRLLSEALRATGVPEH